MLTWEWIMQNLIHVGALLYLVCFLFRDQVLLRLFAIFGDLAYFAFYWAIADQPLWSAIAYCVLNMTINFAMILFVLNDRRESTLGDNDMKLYQGFAGMTPGDFRRLSRLGKWQRAEQPTTLTEEGKPVENLFYILDGDVEITKGGRSIPVDPGLFIGEIAYLKKVPATATVVARPGTLYMSWPHQALRQATDRHDGLRQSLAVLLSGDLANKVARA